MVHTKKQTLKSNSAFTEGSSKKFLKKTVKK